MAKESESLFVNPFSDDSSSMSAVRPSSKMARYIDEIKDAAAEATTAFSANSLPREDDCVEQAVIDVSRAYSAKSREVASANERDLIISLRAAFQGFLVSIVDSAPSEICVVSLTNVNALATWNMLRTSPSTAYITITSLQVDNMVPNAPFPVAVSPEPTARGLSGSESVSDPGQDADAPLLVVGISFAPRHRSGIVVSTFAGSFVSDRVSMSC